TAHFCPCNVLEAGRYRLRPGWPTLGNGSRALSGTIQYGFAECVLYCEPDAGIRAKYRLTLRTELEDSRRFSGAAAAECFGRFARKTLSGKKSEQVASSNVVRGCDEWPLLWIDQSIKSWPQRGRAADIHHS